MLGVFRHIKGRQLSSGKPSKSNSSTLVERLEPRILLSGDGVLYSAAHDPLLENMQPIVQYAELLDTTEQVGRQFPAEGHELSTKLAPPHTLEADLCHPLFTLQIDVESIDTNSNSDVDVGIDNTGPAQTGTDVAVPSDDSEGNGDSGIAAIEIIDAEEPTTNSTAVPTEDGSMPIANSDADLSIEYATSIEIRGPPADPADSLTTSDYSDYAISGEFSESSQG